MVGLSEFLTAGRGDLVDVVTCVSDFAENFTSTSRFLAASKF